MPSKDINVRRETSRRCYRKKVAKEADRSKKRVEEAMECRPIFNEIADRIRDESFNGWVSPQRVLEICGEYQGNFKILSRKEVVWNIELHGYLWHVSDVGVYMGTAPFFKEDVIFEYFKKRVPKTQKKAIKAEMLILNTMLKFMRKGEHVKVFGERNS